MLRTAARTISLVKDQLAPQVGKLILLIITIIPVQTLEGTSPVATLCSAPDVPAQPTVTVL